MGWLEQPIYNLGNETITVLISLEDTAKGRWQRAVEIPPRVPLLLRVPMEMNPPPAPKRKKRRKVVFGVLLIKSPVPFPPFPPDLTFHPVEVFLRMMYIRYPSRSAVVIAKHTTRWRPWRAEGRNNEDARATSKKRTALGRFCFSEPEGLARVRGLTEAASSNL